MPVGADQDAAGGLDLAAGGPLAVRVGHALAAADDVDPDGYPRAGGGIRGRLRPGLAADAGEQREAEVVDEVEGGDGDAGLRGGRAGRGRRGGWSAGSTAGGRGPGWGPGCRRR